MQKASNKEFAAVAAGVIKPCQVKLAQFDMPRGKAAEGRRTPRRFADFCPCVNRKSKIMSLLMSAAPGGICAGCPSPKDQVGFARCRWLPNIIGLPVWSW